MSRENRLKNWHTPDVETDLHRVKPPGELLGGRDRVMELRWFSVRQREGGVSLNFYTRKKNVGVPAYGITGTPEVLREMGRMLQETAEEVMRRQGKKVEE